jgi:hypothetical protein
MQEGFEGWARVLCCGPLAYLSMTAAAIPNIPVAVVCGGLAIAFAIWPERIAYAYRKNRPLPFWSRPVSIVGREAAGDESQTETFAAYRPRLSNLFSAYVSLGIYGILGFNLWRIQVMRVPVLVIAGAVMLLGLLARTET